MCLVCMGTSYMLLLERHSTIVLNEWSNHACIQTSYGYNKPVFLSFSPCLISEHNGFCLNIDWPEASPECNELCWSTCHSPPLHPSTQSCSGVDIRPSPASTFYYLYPLRQHLLKKHAYLMHISSFGKSMASFSVKTFYQIFYALLYSVFSLVPYLIFWIKWWRVISHTISERPVQSAI